MACSVMMTPTNMLVTIMLLAVSSISTQNDAAAHGDTQDKHTNLQS